MKEAPKLLDEHGQPAQEPPVAPPEPAIPPDTPACFNCFWARPQPQGSNYECWSDPPRIIQIAVPSPIRGMPPGMQLMSIRPAVQAGHLCRHFTSRPA
jgi:hypothetical protein